MPPRKTRNSLKTTEKEKPKAKGLHWTMKLSVSMIFIALSFVYLPNFWWHLFMVVDWCTPWEMFNDPYIAKYHEFLMDRLPVRPELPAIEIPLSEATADVVYERSNGYITPIIIRGAVANVSAITKWTDKQFWLDNYADTDVMCKFVGGVDNPSCTIKEAMGEAENSERTYISGESRIFTKHPELLDMVDSPFVESLIKGTRLFTQIFMGYPKMGSDIHAAVGCNVFRQIAGTKKWWLIPVSQTPYVFASLNANGFSSHTKTMVGKQNEKASEWLEKIERYTVTLEPGDVLLNTAWYWHGILNFGEDPDELVIGVPTRYRTSVFTSLRANTILSLLAGYAIQTNVGLDNFLGNADEFQAGIELARRKRGEQTLKK